MIKQAFIGADVFDGKRLYQDAALLLSDGAVDAIIDAQSVPDSYAITTMDGGTILPGFVDLQVNGGGGVMFNDAPSVKGLTTIAEAHARTGTRAFLPTLITDTPDRTSAAIDAVATAIAQKVPGILGLHLEGPHLSLAKKGAHDPALIRPMTANDLAELLDAAKRLPNLMVTVAPENVTFDQVKHLSEHGVIVSLGHTNCSYDTAQQAIAAGATCVTHLFNAMSQMDSRAPGLVGAALGTPGVMAGLIADGIHVHPKTIQVALSATADESDIFLVTDAMSTVGSDRTSFLLNGRKVLRQDGRLTLEDGTLAGADLDLPQAIATLIKDVGVPREQAFAMATAVPAKRLLRPASFGNFSRGFAANAIHLRQDFTYAPLP